MRLVEDSVYKCRTICGTIVGIIRDIVSMSSRLLKHVCRKLDRAFVLGFGNGLSRKNFCHLKLVPAKYGYKSLGG